MTQMAGGWTGAGTGIGAEGEGGRFRMRRRVVVDGGGTAGEQRGVYRRSRRESLVCDHGKIQ